MPPKPKKETTTKGTSKDELIREAGDRISKEENPSESDFKTILSGVDGNNTEKLLAAQYIISYAAKFPKQRKSAVSALIKLSSDSDTRIKYESICGIPKFMEDDQKGVNNVLFKALSDEDSKVQQKAYDIISRGFEGEDNEYKKSVIAALKDQSDVSQSKLVEIISKYYNFSEENKQELIDVCTIAFKSALATGLKLARRKGSILSDEEKAELSAPIFERLRSSLKTNFDEVCNNLIIPLLDNTKSLDQKFPEQLMTVISEEIAPKLGHLYASDNNPGNLPVLKRILERSFELANYIKSDALLRSIYTQIFEKIPKSIEEGHLNFSLIERVLLALYRLAPKYARTFSEIVGKHMPFTGQPNEFEGIKEDENKAKEYIKLLKDIKEFSNTFIQQLQKNRGDVKEDSSLSGIEKKEKIRDLDKNIKAVKNTRSVAELFLKESPFQVERKNITPSWSISNNSKRVSNTRTRVHLNEKGRRNERRSNERRSNERRRYPQRNNGRRSNYGRPHRDSGHRK